MSNSRIAALALIAVLAGASAASAQQPPPSPGMQHRGWDPAQMRARTEARRAERLKALHDVLGIRPDQEGAFQAFAASTHRPERPVGQAQHSPDGDRAAMANMTTPERLDRMAQRMQERTARRQEAFARKAAAIKALYAALGPDQRRTLDALPMLRGHKGRRGGWGKGHGWGGHGGMEGHGQG
jgi:hypothetical protein